MGAADRPCTLFEIVRDAVAFLGALGVAPAVECADQIAGDAADPLEADALADAFFLFLLHGAPSFFRCRREREVPFPGAALVSVSILTETLSHSRDFGSLREIISFFFTTRLRDCGLHPANKCVIIMLLDEKGGLTNDFITVGGSLHFCGFAVMGR